MFFHCEEFYKLFWPGADLSTLPRHEALQKLIRAHSSLTGFPLNPYAETKRERAKKLNVIPIFFFLGATAIPLPCLHPGQVAPGHKIPRIVKN